MKILVTGGSGVIGAGTIPELLQRGHRVRLLSRGAQQDALDYPENVEAFPADISKPESLDGAAEGCDVVIHVTGVVAEAPPEITFEKVNVAGTRHILAEAERAGVSRFIFVSSLGADRGRSEYHRSKRQAEEFVLTFPRDWIIFRPGNVYGPGDDVISMLLKLVRNLPGVPLVDAGEQRFQPVWFEDLGRTLAIAAERPELNRQILEVAGEEITTTRDIIERLSKITDRTPATLSVPHSIVSLATKLAEQSAAFDALLERAGLSLPVNSAKLQMLLEENIIQEPSKNALPQILDVAPTSLDIGLRRLADELPELLPDAGFGSMELKQFSVVIEDSRHDAKALMQTIRDRITEVMPIEFSAEPGAPERVDPGGTLTAALPGRGHIQVRAVETTEQQMTFMTVEGHPLAGTVSFQTHQTENGHVQFMIEIRARAANLIDWLSMKTVGRSMQSANWRTVAARVVEISGGTAVDGIQSTSRVLTEQEAEAATEQMRELAHANSRVEHAMT